MAWALQPEYGRDMQPCNWILQLSGGRYTLCDALKQSEISASSPAAWACNYKKASTA